MASQIASPSTSTSSCTFFSKLVEEKYHKNIAKQPFCMEKGFLSQDAPFTGYTEAILVVFEKHGWGIFCLHFDDVFPEVVKKLYAHVTSLENAFIYVRGASVLLDKDSINAQFEGLDEHTDFVKAMSSECLAQVLTDVCVEEDEEPTTASTHNQELEGDEARTKFVNTESDDEKMDTTQTIALAS
ncbi:hypothetical protein PVK06_024692 [Gossypium arboreum]|uniref:Uncharacterized protein n=1 Tax=Gossypium arboreum TaxID=29729 RepID=A0ABR0PEM3_GOSAR|nr:hypothetical protein PVK06_024692 [Gossypium arboreum]